MMGRVEELSSLKKEESLNHLTTIKGEEERKESRTVGDWEGGKRNRSEKRKINEAGEAEKAGGVGKGKGEPTGGFSL